jgi:hypothetical protein
MSAQELHVNIFRSCQGYICTGEINLLVSFVPTPPHFIGYNAASVCLYINN